MNMFNRKKRFFKKKVNDVQASIWEFEFKVSKSRQVREGVRLDRDRAVEAIARVESAIEGAEKEKKEGLEKEMAYLNDNVRRYEAQMKMIDDQINGIPANGEDPGEQGILETIKGLVELKSMYQDYITHI